MLDTPNNPFAGGEILRTVPTTEPQREIWLSIAVGGDQASLAYNESLSARLAGPVDGAALGHAITAMVERHEALRCTFSGDGQQLLVNGSSPVTLRTYDLRERSTSERDAEHQRILDAQMRTPFDLRDGPLFRADLLLLEPDRSELVLTAHHLVCDGWSIGVLLSELPELYAAALAGRAAQLAAAPSFADYAVAQRAALHGNAAVAAERFWIDALGASPEALDLPVDRARSTAMLPMPGGAAVRDLAAAREDFRLDALLVAGLQRVAKQQRASLAAVLLASFDAFLHRLTGQRRFAVGMPWAGQADSGQHGLVGHCVNTLPVPVQIDPDAPIAAQIAAAKRSLLDCGEHQRLSFGNLLAKLVVPRDPSRVPLIPVVFNLDQKLAAMQVGEARMTYFTNPRVAENFEVFVNATPDGDTIVLETLYSTRLFDRGTMLRRLEEFRELLGGVVASAETPVASLPILPAAEREFLLHTVNRDRAQSPEPPETTTLALLEAQARRSPEALAIVGDDGALRYRDLDRRANHLAHRLVAAGAEPGDHVGICLERGAGMLVAILGIWKAGCAYVPLDPAYPERRLRLVVEDTGMRMLVTCPELDGVVADRPMQRLHLDAGQAEAAPARPLDGGSTAYVLHTSGSTGKPKGVVIDHRALRNHVTAIAHEPGMNRDTVLVAVITLSFDLSCFELFGPLAVGGKVVVASREATRDGAQLKRLIEQHRANMLQATPITFRLLLEAGFAGGPDFTAVNGGEAIPRDLVAALLPRVGSYWNGYGPTEATVHACMARIESSAPPFPIGRPLRNYRVHVLDDRGQLAPTGVTGELYLGGVSVARGYLGKPELTAERFVPDSFSNHAGEKLYRTGDYAYVGADGQLYFLGRRDGQVKLRGFRVELGDVETAIATAPGVGEAAATVREFGPGDARLVGYYVPAAGTEVDEAAVTEHLRQHLPPQMLPQHLLPLAALPMTPNGKVDRKLLPSPETGHGDDGYVAPRTDLQARMARIWAELLHADRVGIRDGFFETGGHSMLAARLMARCRDHFGIELPLRTIFQAQTIESLSAVLEAALITAAPAGNAGAGHREEIEF